MSKFVFPLLSEVFHINYTDSGRASTITLRPIPKEHTYCVVFAMYQRQLLKQLKEIKDITILYEAPPAKNMYHGGVINQQTLVVFEVNE